MAWRPGQGAQQYPPRAPGGVTPQQAQTGGGVNLQQYSQLLGALASSQQPQVRALLLSCAHLLLVLATVCTYVSPSTAPSNSRVRSMHHKVVPIDRSRRTLHLTLAGVPIKAILDSNSNPLRVHIPLPIRAANNKPHRGKQLLLQLQQHPRRSSPSSPRNLQVVRVSN